MSMITPMRFSPDDDGVSPFHSSAYAHAAQGVRLGAVSTQSYEERRQLERNRKHVRHYGNSRLGRLADTRPLSTPARPEQPSVQRIERPQQSEGPSRYSFHEPPTRYNPYQ